MKLDFASREGDKRNREAKYWSWKIMYMACMKQQIWMLTINLVFKIFSFWYYCRSFSALLPQQISVQAYFQLTTQCAVISSIPLPCSCLLQHWVKMLWNLISIILCSDNGYLWVMLGGWVCMKQLHSHIFSYVFYMKKYLQ